DRLALVEVTGGSRAGLVQRLQRRSAKLELPGRLQTDVAVGAAQRNHVAALHDRLPTVIGQSHQQVANAAWLLVAGGAVIVCLVNELFVLGADAPISAGLFSAFERREEISPALDPPTI